MSITQIHAYAGCRHAWQTDIYRGHSKSLKLASSARCQRRCCTAARPQTNTRLRQQRGLCAATNALGPAHLRGNGSAAARELCAALHFQGATLLGRIGLTLARAVQHLGMGITYIPCVQLLTRHHAALEEHICALHSPAHRLSTLLRDDPQATTGGPCPQSQRSRGVARADTRRSTAQVKGVSFANDHSGESRQELLRDTASSDPVLCIAEPDNPVDDSAVRIVTTRGQIGYAPADTTAYFEHGCAPGFIDWAAANPSVEGSLIGASVTAVPGKRAGHIQPLPGELAPWADLSAHLPQGIWASIEQLHLEFTFDRCQLTGLHAMSTHPEKARSPPPS